MWDDHLGQMSGVENSIDLAPDATPYRSVPYRAGIRMRNIEKPEAGKMVEQEVAVPAPPADWAAPVAFVPTGGQHVTVLRRLQATERDDYARCISDPQNGRVHRQSRDSKVFSTLDANSGYWQILIS